MAVHEDFGGLSEREMILKSVEIQSRTGVPVPEGVQVVPQTFAEAHTQLATRVLDVLGECVCGRGGVLIESGEQHERRYTMPCGATVHLMRLATGYKVRSIGPSGDVWDEGFVDRVEDLRPYLEGM